MRVTRGGQVAIPPEIQEKSGIRPGAEVDVSYENGAITIRPGELSARAREFLQRIDNLRRAAEESRRKNTGSLEEVEGLSRGEQFVRLLAGAGRGRMTADETMELTRGPYEELDPR